MRILKKSEYPENIACLAQGCPSCPVLKQQGVKSHNDCKYFQWKINNINKYGVEVDNGRIKKVWV